MAENSLGSSAAVEKHVDHMEVIVITFVVQVLVVLLAAADIPKGFEILGIHLRTEDAYDSNTSSALPDSHGAMRSTASAADVNPACQIATLCWPETSNRLFAASSRGDGAEG